MNGTILGNDCAIFLCTFISSLVMIYNDEAEKSQVIGLCAINPLGPLNNSLYRMSLCVALQMHCYEDYSQHGRFLAMKDALIRLNEGQPLDP